MKKHAHRWTYVGSSRLGGHRQRLYHCRCGELRVVTADVSWKLIYKTRRSGWRVWFYGSRNACKRYAERINRSKRLPGGGSKYPPSLMDAAARAVHRETPRSKYPPA